MKYIVEEEELKDFAIKCVNDDGVGELSINVRIQDLIQSKTPVEEIAEGELFYKGKKSWIRNAEYKNEADPVFKKYEGKNIKIYIEVVK